MLSLSIDAKSENLGENAAVTLHVTENNEKYTGSTLLFLTSQTLSEW